MEDLVQVFDKFGLMDIRRLHPGMRSLVLRKVLVHLGFSDKIIVLLLPIVQTFTAIFRIIVPFHRLFATGEI